MPWAIKGVTRGEPHGEDIEQSVAYFSVEKNAQKYLKSSRLKQPNKFKQASLLYGYDYAWITKFGEFPYWIDSIPLDPEIDF